MVDEIFKGSEKMKVKELVDRLNYYVKANKEYGDYEIGIEFEPDGLAIGPIPTVAIKDDVIFGFDWNDGKCILIPKEPLKLKKENKK